MQEQPQGAEPPKAVDTDSALDGLIAVVREAVRPYVSLVGEVAGVHARSLALFGAAAAGTFDSARHTISNVLVLDAVDLDLLRRLAEHGARLGKARVAAPLIMTPAYVRASLDSFPLELIEIHQQHVTVLGGEYFAELSFDDHHVRLQCEREFKRILIGLRQGLLAAAGREKLVPAMEEEACGGLLRTLRGMLWLKGHRQAMPAADVLNRIEQATELKLPGLRASLMPTGAHGWREFDALYADVAALGEIADAW